MRGRWFDGLIGLALFGGALAAYVATLAPTVLDGDAALFQYTPQVLGVTYPTGYPVYLLLSKVWLSLFPFGQVAWRMNLFSALCASLALPIFYDVARRVWHSRWAALTSVLIYATLPTYWLWATEAKIYSLNILLYSIVLWFALAEEQRSKRAEKRTPLLPTPYSLLHTAYCILLRHRYKLGAFILGLQVGVHSTTVLLIPGILWLFWLNYNARNQESSKALKTSSPTPYSLLPTPLLRFMVGPLIAHLPYFIAPLLLYLYVPLRADGLIARYGWQGAVNRGLLADFYQAGLAGLARYFTAADFTGGVVTNWGRVPADFIAVYLPFLRDDFTLAGIALGLIGVGAMAWLRRAYLWPFLLLYLIPIPFVLTYGQGEQRAFLLTSYLVFALFAGGLVALIHRAPIANSQQLTANRKAVVAAIAAGLVCLLWPYQQAQANIEWLQHKWSTATYDYWADVLSHPLEPGAGVIATWGDLTSMWYMQHIEERRPDLAGLYPPDVSALPDWLARYRSLYVAGPTLDAWGAEQLAAYQVIPWGRLVRVASQAASPLALLPELERPQTAVFGGRLRLAGAEFPASVDSGGVLYGAFAWESLADLPGEARYSLRLAQGDGILAQKDDTLRSGWFPLDYIPAGQPFVGAYPLQIPPGTWPGSYRLQLVVYDKRSGEWPLATGEPDLDLGQVDVRLAPPANPPGPARFNDEIALDRADFSVSRVEQGKGFALTLLWQALRSPQDNYTLTLELVDPTGQVWRSWQQPAETAHWQPGQQVRQLVDIIVPAEAPPGEGALTLRASWLRPDGSPLPAKRWLIPQGESVELGAPRIEEKENRLWTQPDSQYTLEANFEDKASIVGYDMPEQVVLAADESAGPVLPMTLYWQGRGPMAQVYRRFAHLLDQDGNLVAQADGVQGRGKEPTTGWATGEYVTDPFTIQLPTDLPSGTYTVIAGLYLPPQGPRLLRLDEQGQAVADFVSLSTVDIQR